MQSDDETDKNENGCHRNYGQSGRKCDENINVVVESERKWQDEESEKIEFLKVKIYNDFKSLITTNKEIQNFEYEVTFKDDMEIFQH